MNYPGLIDGAGPALLFTLGDFHRSRPLQGHTLALPDLWRIDCQADEEMKLQIDGGAAWTTAGLQWVGIVDRHQSDFGSLLLLISYAIQ